MTITDWREFRESLTIQPSYWETLPKPTVLHLDHFETQTGFRLPDSYRDYILLFGPGQLHNDWDIFAPGYGETVKQWDLALRHGDILNDFKEQMRLYPDFFPQAQHNRLSRCVYFCWRYKDAYGWDPEEVCNPKAHEYAVYRIVEDKRILRVAQSFREFVEGTVSEMLSLEDWDEEELGPRLAFRPACRPIPPHLVG